MNRVIVIHGNSGGTGNDSWLPWLKSRLQKLGVACETPNMPDPILARSSIWLPYIRDVLKADENTILVGHSSGAVAAMRYAESDKIYGSVLVGVCYTDLGYDDEKASGYYDHPWDWRSIKNNQKWVEIFASSDDPYIDISEPRFIRDKLDAEYHELPNQGHFSGTGSDDKLEFPELLAVIMARINPII